MLLRNRTKSAEPESQAQSELAVERFHGFSALVMQVSTPWASTMIVAAVISTLHIDVSPDHKVSGSVGVTSLTALLLALVWLPPLLRILGIAGGGVKTPAGEATTPGLAHVFEWFDAEVKRETIPAVLAGLNSPNVVTDPERRSDTRALRRDLEFQLAAVTPHAGGVREALDSYAREYESLRTRMPTGRERTLRMTSLTAEARAIARTAPLATVDLRNMLETGSDGERVIALAVAQDHPSARLFDLICGAILRSRSAFEQYQALGAALEVLLLLDTDQRHRLAAVIESALSDSERDIRDDASRRQLAEALLAELGSAPHSHD
jgi:hypothetical protein